MCWGQALQRWPKQHSLLIALVLCPPSPAELHENRQHIWSLEKGICPLTACEFWSLLLEDGSVFPGPAKRGHSLTQNLLLLQFFS